MNRKIAISGISIAVTLALAGGAAYAFFSDTNSSTGNVLGAGTLELELDDNNQSATSSAVTMSIMGSNMVPGGTPVSGFISFHNAGSVDIAEIEMSTTASETADPGADSFLGNVMNLTVMTGSDNTCTTGQQDWTGTLATQFGGTSPLTLSELDGQTFDAFPGITSGGADMYLCMTAQMDSTAGNQYQGDAVNVDFAFTANQSVSQ